MTDLSSMLLVTPLVGAGLLWMMWKAWNYSPTSESDAARGLARMPTPVKFFKALKRPEIPVVGKALLTGNELEFWHRLQGALPEFVVLPQVAMGALVQNLKQGDWETIKLFRGKICDFAVVVCKTGQVVAVIELDDISHDRHKDLDRDKVLASAGIATLRFHSRAKPTAPVIRQALQLVGAVPKFGKK